MRYVTGHISRGAPARRDDNRYDVTVLSCDPRDSHAWLSLGRFRLAARRWESIRRGQKVMIRIRPEDILLCEGHPGRVSARNVLPGHVKSSGFVPGGTRIDLDVGFPLSAVVTREAARELRLRRGTPIYAIIKAVVVMPELEVQARYRVSLKGRRGMLEYGKIDFMRAIDRTGSLSAAASLFGITYRTSWMWTQEINALWGRPLIACTHGGKGGGGAVLTPEARGVMALARRIEAAGD